MSVQHRKPATIEDVARISGVSIATVSRVVHNPEKVAESTRKRVRAAISQCGYTPNVMARNLRMRQSKMTLVLVPDIGNVFFSNILLGIEKTAQQHGYGILIGNTDNDPGREQDYMRYLSGNQADGLLLLTGHSPYPESKPGEPAHPPVVAISERPPDQDIPFVGIDNRAAARAATEHLLSFGHRSIAHIAGPPWSVLTDQRIAGYRDALTDANVKVDESFILDGDFTIESGRAAVERLFIRDHLPTAFFCANDETAIGVMLALHARRYDVPKDFSVIGFDDIHFASCSMPPLTTMQQPRRRMGEEAMLMMLEILETGLLPEEPVVLHTDLIVRNSTGPAREPSLKLRPRLNP